MLHAHMTTRTFCDERCLSEECIGSHAVHAHRNMHADALEWLWFVNSHAEVVYKLMYGDKDTFRLAFALAGKPDYFEQVRSTCLQAKPGTKPCHAH